MTREYFDKKDASDAEKIGDALFLRPTLLRRQFNGQSRLSRNTRKTASNRRFQGAKEPLGASRKSQQRTIEDGLTALYCSISDRLPHVERALRANVALQRAKKVQKRT